jgi:hypothetical protein
MLALLSNTSDHEVFASYSGSLFRLIDLTDKLRRLGGSITSLVARTLMTTRKTKRQEFLGAYTMIEILKCLISYRTIEYAVVQILNQTPTDTWAPVMPFSKNDEMNTKVTKLVVNKRQWLALMTRPPTPFVIPCSRPTENHYFSESQHPRSQNVPRQRVRNETDLFNWHRHATVSEDGMVHMGVWSR